MKNITIITTNNQSFSFTYDEEELLEENFRAAMDAGEGWIDIEMDGQTVSLNLAHVVSIEWRDINDGDNRPQ